MPQCLSIAQGVLDDDAGVLGHLLGQLFECSQGLAEVNADLVQLLAHLERNVAIVLSLVLKHGLMADIQVPLLPDHRLLALS
eukprot:1944959-Alexandrium_andersonii.AAC.1